MGFALQGGRQYPSFSRPVISEFELRIPILPWDSGEMEQEEKLLRMRTLSTVDLGLMDAATSSRSQASMDKLVLSMVQLACKADKSQRALELCSMLYLPAAYDAACKIANYHRMTALVERIMLLKELLIFTVTKANVEQATRVVVRDGSGNASQGKVDILGLIRQANATVKRGSMTDSNGARKRQTTLKDRDIDV
ncbi:hypothetical protein THASP1DRAFT_22102 [Thamnocephalis sphaerospora]|uniref:WDHD1/CFT4 helical bundle domain-containing protein n=1 Tax=Thamnocephalis sphaerospora TaxID=78915 RepID=A0A4P9XV68_9FUNG|nr:hypothetical protein THASP1DRAFT_22102 [Thamnocephalis sphaerospora]|eukprot:RKP10164.1 hypothetical protein THASP1DRAFT_22102 [Thamnocephalis sphaerospora]